MSDWTAKLIDITQPDCPNSNGNIHDRDDRQDHPLPSDWSDQENFWSGKTYDKVRPTSLKAVQMPPPMRVRRVTGMRTCIHKTTGLRFNCRSHHPNLLQVGPQALGLILILTAQYTFHGKGPKIKIILDYILPKLHPYPKKPLMPSIN